MDKNSRQYMAENTQATASDVKILSFSSKFKKNANVIQIRITPT